MNPFQVVKDFERALAEYTGAPYVVTTTSCTMALLLAVAWHLRPPRIRAAHAGDLMRLAAAPLPGGINWVDQDHVVDTTPARVEIPKRTYVGVPMSIIHAGGRPTFRDETWRGTYQLMPLPIWDSARWFTSGMYHPRVLHGSPATSGVMLCVSFHWSKHLGIQQGGAILHDDPLADAWLRMARFDGRVEGLSPARQAEMRRFEVLGWHCYMSPEVAAAGLVRLSHLPRHNEPLPNDDYPDLSQMAIFQ